MGNVFVLDLSKCNGCYNCQIACKDEFVGQAWAGYSAAEPDIGQFWMKVYEKEMGTAPKLRVPYIPQPCMHCDNAPCIKAASNGAVYKRSDGLVIIDPILSVGQQNLVNACPYGAIYWNSSLNIPQKCTGCAHILDAATAGTPMGPGLTVPRCVNACPTGALQFGSDQNPTIQALMAQAEVLHPEYSTQPRVYYLNLPQPFIAGDLFDPEADECIKGATVTATDITTGTVYTATTDNYGDFWLNNLPGDRTYNLSITATGYLTRTMVVFLEDAKNVGDIPLFAGST